MNIIQSFKSLLPLLKDPCLLLTAGALITNLSCERPNQSQQDSPTHVSGVHANDGWGEEEKVIAEEEYYYIDPRRYLENRLPGFNTLSPTSQQLYIDQIGPTVSNSLSPRYASQVETVTLERAAFEIWLHTTYPEIDEKTVGHYMIDYGNLPSGKVDQHDYRKGESTIIELLTKDDDRLQALKDKIGKQQGKKHKAH